MITNIYLKAQPKKKLAYPNCQPNITTIVVVAKDSFTVDIIEIYNPRTLMVESKYAMIEISRVEFRP